MEEKTKDKYQEPTEREQEALKEVPEQMSLRATEGREAIPGKEAADLRKEKEIKTEKESKTEPTKKEILEEASPAPTSSEPPSAQVQKQIKRLQGLDRQNQVKVLSDLAFQQGLDFTIEVARGLGNAYVLDELHDSLIDELYKQLVEKGKLKKL